MLGFSQRLSERLQRPDLTQLLLALFALLMMVLMVAWPQVSQSNDAWFALARAKLVIAVLLGLGYGMRAPGLPLSEARLTLVALLLFLFFSLPFDLASYAASFPNVPLWYALTLIPLNLIAYFGIGWLIMSGMKRLRLSSLVVLVYPILIILIGFADIWLGRVVFNPIIAISGFSPLHFALVTGLSFVTMVLLWRKSTSQEGSS